ncbi:leucyl aminopeptidase [Actinocrinis puniceicyclus]|uniref:Probable cytosol aminopeptidase n=1 Tax=Actinocrinis puniceicyclus TaxID=977794 RepID=A0A8J7WQ61_9ACTN|nr:leucyl aminopeptidase [Actinocrinis puniceicyclus]MBS2963484.1 leucyl aminopeptidase [Actinocrinis puniceicyclus]
MTTISLQSGPPAGVEADALVIGLYQGEDGVMLAPGAEPVDEAFGGRLAHTFKALGATGAADEVTRVPAQGGLRAPVVVGLGLGSAGDGEVVGVTGLEDLRRAAGSALRSLAGFGTVALVTPVSGAEVVEATALGAALAAYSFDGLKTGDGADRKAPVAHVVLVTPGEPGAEAIAAGERAQVVADAVKAARDLVNTPPSHLFPQAFAQAAQAAVQAAGVEGLTIEVLDDAALREGGYGGLIGVGQGSSRPPRLVRITYTHPDAQRSLAFVGKGITFDTGGISLKPAGAMEIMKSDMAGAAAVAQAVVAVARLGLPVTVTAWAALAENMPGGNAIRPSDVLRIYGGKTVEVLNTDAEGRLVLADAIVRAAEENPDAIVDVATLTGAQVAALGHRTAAVMSNDEEFRTQVESAAERAGEDLWPMPLPAYLRKSLDSDVADLANLGDRMGGMLVAGVFLKEFVAEGVPWAHLDIAGPAYNTNAPYGYTPKCGTGYAVRTLVQLAQDAADGLL